VTDELINNSIIVYSVKCSIVFTTNTTLYLDTTYINSLSE